MSDKVILSLLALDSYNRGYDQSLFLEVGDNPEGQNELERWIGNARVIEQNITQSAQAAGFYAIAYALPDKVVISYRGTSFNNNFDETTLLDATNGWITGAGLTGSLISAIDDALLWPLPIAPLNALGISSRSQAELAIEFYEAIQEDSVFEGVAFAGNQNGHKPIVTTGHSLGGGLSGYVSSLTGGEYFAFDHMPFGFAAENAAFWNAFRQAVSAAELAASQEALVFNLNDILLLRPTDLPSSGEPITSPVVRIYEAFIDAFTAAYKAPDFSNGIAEHLQGEALQALRVGDIEIPSNLIVELMGETLVGFIDALLPIEGQLAVNGLTRGVLNYTSGQVDIASPAVSNYGIHPENPLSLHSMSLLTILQFGEEQWIMSEEGGSEDWKTSIKYIGAALSDDDIGGHVGFTQGTDATTGATGRSSSGAQMSTAIAYSLLKAPEAGGQNYGLVFGDTGIRALFSDADDLGVALPSLPSLAGDEVRSAIGEVVAEFAGLLAFNKVEEDQWDGAANGALSIASDGSTLMVDLTDPTWALDGILAVAHNISNAAHLRTSVLESALDPVALNQDQLDFVITQLNEWAGTYAGFDLDEVGSISFALQAGGASTIADTIPLIILSDDDENFVLGGVNATAGQGIIVASGGANTINITGGAEGQAGPALIGGNGNDIFTGSDRNEFFYGGRGNNIIDGGGGYADTAVYVDSGTSNLVYTGDESSGSFQIFGNGYNDNVSNIERIVISAATPTFKLVGNIGPDTNVIISSQTSDNVLRTQAIDASLALAGQIIYLNRSGYTSQIFDTQTGGSIAFENFNTTIIGSGFDDEISDGSGEEKTIVAGAGNDIVDVSGTTAPARLEGGEGSDILRGGDGNDVIIDQQAAPSSAIYIQPGGGWSPIRPAIGSIEAGEGNDQILIDIGGLPGITFGGDEYGYGPGPEIQAGGSPLGYFLDPGQGNDEVDINFNGFMHYTYERGDGVDTVDLQSSGTFGLSTNPNEFPLSTVEMTFLSIDASAYSRSEAYISFAETSRELVMIDPPSGDNGDLYVIKGTIRVQFSDYDSIIIENVYGVVAEDWRFADASQFNVFNARFPLEIRFSDEEVNQVSIEGSAYGRSSASSSIFSEDALFDIDEWGRENLAFATATDSVSQRVVSEFAQTRLMDQLLPASVSDDFSRARAVRPAAIDRPSGSATGIYLDPSQHELIAGPARVDLHLLEMPVEAEGPSSRSSILPNSLIGDSLQPKFGASVYDAEIARKLAIIRQDMSAFGIEGGTESGRLASHVPESLYFYA